MSEQKSRGDKIVEDTMNQLEYVLEEHLPRDKIQRILDETNMRIRCQKKFRDGRKCGVILCPHHEKEPIQERNYFIDYNHLTYGGCITYIKRFKNNIAHTGQGPEVEQLE